MRRLIYLGTEASLICHLDNECYHQINRKRSSPAESKITKDETVNMTCCDKCNCNRKVENKCTEIDEPNNIPPGIGYDFVMCHPPSSQEADGFQLLVDLGLWKHFIGPELIRGVESRMLEYTRVEPPMEITVAGNNVLRGTAPVFYSS